MRIAGLGLTELIILLAFLFLAATYLLPTLIAIARKHPDRLPLILVNIFAGWTLLGWAVCMIWAIFGGRGRW